MTVELRHLRYFLAVAHEGNVTRAAARLGISQPPLSQQLRDLERRVGTPLFTRTPQGMALTAAGAVFRDEAQRLVGATEAACAAARRAAEGATGTLRLGFTASAAFHPMVVDAIRRLRRGWPDVHLLVEEHNTTALTERLLRGTLDAAFLRPGRGGAQGLDLLWLDDEPMRVALPAQHRLAAAAEAGPPVALAALADEDMVFFPRSVGLSLYDTVVDACRTAGFSPRIVQEAPQLSTVLNLVAAELGFSIVPASMTQVAITGVRYAALPGDGPRARLALACRADARTPVVANLFAVCAAATATAAAAGPGSDAGPAGP